MKQGFFNSLAEAFEHTIDADPDIQLYIIPSHIRPGKYFVSTLNDWIMPAVYSSFSGWTENAPEVPKVKTTTSNKKETRVFYVSEELDSGSSHTARYDNLDEALVRMGEIAYRLGGEVDKVTLRDQPEISYVLKVREGSNSQDFFHVRAVLIER